MTINKTRNIKCIAKKVVIIVIILLVNLITLFAIIFRYPNYSNNNTIEVSGTVVDCQQIKLQGFRATSSEYIICLYLDNGQSYFMPTKFVAQQFSVEQKHSLDTVIEKCLNKTISIKYHPKSPKRANSHRIGELTVSEETIFGLTETNKDNKESRNGFVGVWAFCTIGFDALLYFIYFFPIGGYSSKRKKRRNKTKA